MKKTVWFCQTVRVKGKTFSKEKSKTWDFFNLEGCSEKAGRDFFRKDITKKYRRKEGSGDETTLTGVCAQIEVHTPQLSLHMQRGSSQSFLGDSIKFFFDWWEKASALRHGHWPHHRCTAFCRSSSTVSENSKFGELVVASHTQQCTVSVAPRQFSAPLWAAPSVKRTTPLLRLRSRLVRCFHFDSFRVRFSILALPSITHFIISFQPTPHSSFSESISTPKHCKGASTSHQWLTNFFPQVLRPSLAGHKLEPFMVVAHVHFADDESRGDSISASLLVSSSKLLSCLSTIFLGSSTQTI